MRSRPRARTLPPASLINDNQLSGPIPTEIGLLSSMSLLSVQNNAKLTGLLPTELGALTRAQKLFFSSTGITGTLPSELGLITDGLIRMDVADTAVCGLNPWFPRIGPRSAQDGSCVSENTLSLCPDATCVETTVRMAVGGNPWRINWSVNHEEPWLASFRVMEGEAVGATACLTPGRYTLTVNDFTGAGLRAGSGFAVQIGDDTVVQFTRGDLACNPVPPSHACDASGRLFNHTESFEVVARSPPPPLPPPSPPPPSPPPSPPPLPPPPSPPGFEISITFAVLTDAVAFNDMQLRSRLSKYFSLTLGSVQVVTAAGGSPIATAADADSSTLVEVRVWQTDGGASVRRTLNTSPAGALQAVFGAPAQVTEISSSIPYSPPPSTGGPSSGSSSGSSSGLRSESATPDTDQVPVGAVASVAAFAAALLCAFVGYRVRVRRAAYTAKQEALVSAAIKACENFAFPLHLIRASDFMQWQSLLICTRPRHERASAVPAAERSLIHACAPCRCTPFPLCLPRLFRPPAPRSTRAPVQNQSVETVRAKNMHYIVDLVTEADDTFCLVNGRKRFIFLSHQVQHWRARGTPALGQRGKGLTPALLLRSRPCPPCLRPAPAVDWL
jgi:hypothetical protein